MSNAATLTAIGSIFSGSLRKAAPARGQIGEPERVTVAEPPPRVKATIAPWLPSSIAMKTTPMVPPAAVPATPPPAVAPAKPVTIEAALIEILDAPLYGQTAAVAYKQKEEAIGVVMSKLSVLEARALYKRLATPTDGDELAQKFASRMTGERRNRLLVFLGDARRREAIAIARR